MKQETEKENSMWILFSERKPEDINYEDYYLVESTEREYSDYWLGQFTEGADGRLYLDDGDFTISETGIYRFINIKNIQ